MQLMQMSYVTYFFKMLVLQKQNCIYFQEKYP